MFRSIPGGGGGGGEAGRQCAGDSMKAASPKHGVCSKAFCNVRMQMIEVKTRFP